MSKPHVQEEQAGQEQQRRYVLLYNLPVSYVDVVTVVHKVYGRREELPLPIIPCPVLIPEIDDPPDIRRVRVVHELVKYLPSYGRAEGVIAPLRTPHVEGGVHDVPDLTVVVGGGNLETSRLWMVIISVARNVKIVHEPPRPRLDIGSPLVSGGATYLVIGACGVRLSPRVSPRLVIPRPRCFCHCLAPFSAEFGYGFALLAALLEEDAPTLL